MFSVTILELIDREIERLQAARDILASLLPSRAASQRTRKVDMPAGEQTPLTEEATPEERKEVVATILKSRATRQRRVVRRRRSAPEIASRALGGQIPDGPIVVKASVAERPERAKTAEPALQAEELPGTLDALVRELAERKTLAMGATS